ncbi:MAG: diaminopimelate decarboxylase [Paludibacteraceae bacterium]|nr:diaminopimelate decarboxylase [Paludibacteraceae bacterium]
MSTHFPIAALAQHPTPFYYYDMELLRRTLALVKEETARYGFEEHYAVKANANPVILKTIAAAGFGADCVSGGEIEAAMEAGFPASRIVYAGVGKSDWEIRLALKCGIACFNVESEAEMQVISEIAGELHTTAPVALRVNPNVDAHTHAKITTGLSENKFGINLSMLEHALQTARQLPGIRLKGLHFHIGSQITELEVFRTLAVKVNALTADLRSRGYAFETLNFGGGLGIDYQHPDTGCIPDFKGYFALFNELIDRTDHPGIHFELGRAIVAQCGSLISKVLYVKEGEVKKFAILDAGMTDLLRPAMYDAFHAIENISSTRPRETYDVVGPVCESSDVFGKDRQVAGAARGDLMAIRSAGAYGEAMASTYNCRPMPKAVFSDSI